MQHPIVILPGIGGSGDNHWQSLWERRWKNENANIVRFAPPDWNQPKLEDWLLALDQAIKDVGKPPVLVAHSLSCLLVAHWAHQRGQLAAQLVRAAFLVAVPDPDGPAFPPQAQTFKAVARNPLPFPALVVCSTNDPYGTVDYAKSCAQSWQADCVAAGALGHINGASNIGDWPQGQALFASFCAALA